MKMESLERVARATDPLRSMQDIATSSLKPNATVEFADTVSFRTPVVSIDAARRERERILSPGAGGAPGNAYKMLRTQVLHRLDALHANTLAILSPTAGAGKTLTAINLAIAIAAEYGRTALLVDFDFRNPCVANRFGIDVKVGIEDCLSSRQRLQDAMIKVAGYERLTLLPARRRVDQSSELLSDRRCAEAMTELRSRYANRIVIVDLPPVLQADDALAVLRHVQAGLVVVGESRSKRADLSRMMELVSHVNVIGTVLNGSRNADDKYY